MHVSPAAEAFDSDSSRCVSNPICVSVTIVSSHCNVVTTLATTQQTCADSLCMFSKNEDRSNMTQLNKMFSLLMRLKYL